MNADEIIAAIGSRQAGGFASVIVNRPAKLRKAYEGENIRKRSRIAIQLANYANRKPVREAVESGEREAPQLPGHIDRAEVIGGVRFWIGKNGKVYLPVPLAGEGGQAKAEWLVNGEPATLESIAAKLLASETASRPSKETVESKGQAQFIGIGLENIESIC